MNNVNQLRRETAIVNGIIYTVTPGPFGVMTYRRRWRIVRAVVGTALLLAFAMFVIALQ